MSLEQFQWTDFDGDSYEEWLLKYNNKQSNRILTDDDLPLGHRLAVKNFLINLEKKIFDGYIDNFFGKYKIYFITINPPIDLSLEKKDLLAIAKKFNKVEFCYSIYNFEKFVSSQQFPERLHSHSVVISQKKKRFKTYTKLTPSWILLPSGMTSKRILKQSVKFMEIKNVKDLKFRIAYVLGLKRCKEKMRLVKKDQEWRKTVPLKDYYINDNEENFYTVSKYLTCLIRDVKAEYATWLQNQQ